MYFAGSSWSFTEDKGETKRWYWQTVTRQRENYSAETARCKKDFQYHQKLPKSKYNRRECTHGVSRFKYYPGCKLRSMLFFFEWLFWILSYSTMLTWSLVYSASILSSGFQYLKAYFIELRPLITGIIINISDFDLYF